MKPVSPIVPGVDLPETLYAKDQPEYQSLPVFRQEDGTVLSRWHLTWWERMRVLCKGDIYLWVMTVNQPLQPVMLQVERPEVETRRKYWPIKPLWRWTERGYRKRYGSWTHSASGPNGPQGSWVLHLGPLKLVFG